MRTRIVTIVLCVALKTTVFAQNYHAIHGSSYAGSLGIGNNPSSIVNTPFKWDIDLFSFQVKNSTNIVSVYHYSLLSSGKKSEYLFTAGDYARFGHVNYNSNIFNARFAINRYKAFGFGANLRGYTNVKTSPYNFIDTLHSSREFFNLGNFNRTLSANMASSNWLELFGTYAQTIWDRQNDRLNAGVTLKITRSLAGGYMALQNGRAITDIQNPNARSYVLENISAQYGYSRNLDLWDRKNSTKTNIKNFLSDTEGSYSMDLGVEYLVKPKAIPTVFDHEEEFYDYEWKIGLSLLDVGASRYKYSPNSLLARGVRDDIADSVLDDKFDNVTVDDFSDSLASIARNSRVLGGTYTIGNPTRLVLNVDKYMGGNIFINGDLTINLTKAGQKALAVQELNLLTLTPRWETKRLGAYLPVSVNTRGRLWIGGAFKVGPLLLGIHNWANIFSNKKINNGGGYLAIVIRSTKAGSRRADKKLDCPPGF